MRSATLLASVLLLCGAALAGGTVAFNLTWYPMPNLPSVTGDFPMTEGIVIADFNRDGIPDVAYTVPCESSCASVIVKFGTGGGKLGPDMSYQWGWSSLAELAAADVNGDGWLDLLLRDPLQSGLVLLLNNGDGTMQMQNDNPNAVFSTVASGSGVGGYASSFTLGDFNQDGKIDVAKIDCDQPNGGFPFGFGSCWLNVFLGDGTGGFTLKQSVKLAAGDAYSLDSADINTDGKLDLVNVRGSVGLIWWGRGDGSFAAPTYLRPPTTDPMDAVAVADFNNDGRLDLALLSGNPCHPPDPDTGACDPADVNTVWMYKNNGGTSFTLTQHTQFAANAGTIVAADINGDLNQDLNYYNPFAAGMDPVLGSSGGFYYALGLGNDTLGSQGNLPGDQAAGALDPAAAFRDMDGDSRADYAVIDWNENQLGIGIQTGGWKNCPPPSSAKLAAKICGLSNGATVTSPLLLKASGNSPAGVNQLQVWIDGKKQYVRWGDQLAKRFTLSSGTHRIAVVANDRYMGHATTAVYVIVP